MEAANILGISLRSYKSYENDEVKKNTKKYQYFIEKIKEINPIDEEHGISDIDLLICSDIKGLKFYGLVEALREKLHKKVDLLNIEQLKDNLDLTKEILKDGIKIC